MKKLIALIVLTSVFVMANAQEEYKLTGSSVKIDGTSTLHNWTADVTKVSGKLAMSDHGGGVNLSSVNIEMDVYSIKSDKGSTMETNIYNALKAKSNPKITFQLTKVNSISGTLADLTAVVSGNLTIAGTTKAVDLTVKGKQKANGAIEFSGSKKLKMTTFNVKPPTFMFGAMKTGDDVTITFSATFTK
ncbi:YceI family protein [Sphingobacteriales bacterium UPWRP_1]|nr:hypothetical protein B6N25_02205 [Sphingobacteriales bacterium TSM_CSS]PSJ75560.1 YceI family protein [Sphingobacteriales bacterium UPWRP_1]